MYMYIIPVQIVFSRGKHLPKHYHTMTSHVFTCVRVLCLECRVSWVRVPPEAAHFSFDCLGCAVLLCLVVCLILLASFFSSLIKTCTCIYIVPYHKYVYTCTCTSILCTSIYRYTVILFSLACLSKKVCLKNIHLVGWCVHRMYIHVHTCSG